VIDGRSFFAIHCCSDRSTVPFSSSSRCVFSCPPVKVWNSLLGVRGSRVVPAPGLVFCTHLLSHDLPPACTLVVLLYPWCLASFCPSWLLICSPCARYLIIHHSPPIIRHALLPAFTRSPPIPDICAEREVGTNNRLARRIGLERISSAFLLLFLWASQNFCPSIVDTTRLVILGHVFFFHPVP